MATWSADAPGVVALPSGRLVRGRGLRRAPDLRPDPDFGVYLFSSPLTTPPAWEHRELQWPDFGAPADESDAHDAISEAWARAVDSRVEVACMGGRGRTGTFLACTAVLDGLDPASAVRWIRTRYDRLAVETPLQRRFITRFARAQERG